DFAGIARQADLFGVFRAAELLQNAVGQISKSADIELIGIVGDSFKRKDVPQIETIGTGNVVAKFRDAELGDWFGQRLRAGRREARARRWRLRRQEENASRGRLRRQVAKER